VIGRGIRRVSFGALAFAAASCAPAPVGPERQRDSRQDPAFEPKPLTVVVLALDGVRWQEVFHGVDPELATAQNVPQGERGGAAELMPNLHALIEKRGAAIGADASFGEMRASGPAFVSLPGYAELATGLRSPGCADNQCSGARSPSVLDELASSPESELGDVAAVTSWEPMARVLAQGDTRVALTAGRLAGQGRELFARESVGAELLKTAAASTPFPGTGDFRPDRHTARIASRYLVARRPRLLFVGLGETDEYAHRNDYRGYLGALRLADSVIGELTKELDKLAAQGSRTALFVTTDHGRAKNFVDHGAAHPESARVWLVAAGSAIPALGRIASPTPRRLADLAPTLRVLFELPQPLAPDSGTPLTELLGKNVRGVH